MASSRPTLCLVCALASACGGDESSDPSLGSTAASGSSDDGSSTDTTTSGDGSTSSSSSTTSESTNDAESGPAESSDGTTGSATPGYQPFFVMDCNDGELGTRAQGPDALADVVGDAEPKVVYDDAQAVDSIGQSCRSIGRATENFFGGRYVDVPSGIGVGDDVWMRHALFFPAGFCFGYGTTSGDGWGSTKWMRIEFDNGDPGDRLTLQLGNFADQGCNDTAEVYGATREYAGNANLRPPSPSPITTDAWHMVQWHVHLADDESGFVRFWVDDVYQGQVDGITVGAADREMAFVQYGDYWNGSPFEDVEWFLDEVIMTTEPPDTLDAGGLPYIDPSAPAHDWE
ncbi:MAG TPA: hypothetical protein VG755_24500 [Nannocystaceae bacterium]|nr:hypothetical protein [Nannocystaceae bacterium]